MSRRLLVIEVLSYEQMAARLSCIEERVALFFFYQGVKWFGWNFQWVFRHLGQSRHHLQTPYMCRRVS